MNNKIKRREFLGRSLGGILFVSGIRGLNSSVSSAKSIEVKQNLDEELLWVETSGSPGEIGYQYGRKLKDRLQEHCKNRTSDIYKRFKRDVIEKGRKVMLEVTEHEFPYIVEEMRGIAEGAEVSYDDYSLSVVSGGFSVFKEEGDSCSNVIFKQSNNGPLLGKTLDGTSPDMGTFVVRLINSEKENVVLCVTRIDGISTETGLNDKGLGLGTSSIHFFTTNPRGIRRDLLLRPLLHECSNVEEGVQFLAAHPTIKSGYNYVMVDIGGNGAIGERSPIEYYVRRMEGKVIFCSNHTATTCIRKLEKSRGVDGDKNSDDRFQNLKKITSARSFRMSLESMKKILRNHDNSGGICQHGNANMYTRMAYINIVKEGKLLVSPGCACKHDFKEFVIS